MKINNVRDKEKDTEMSKIQNEFLRLIPGGQNLIIDPTDGSETLAVATDVFAYIDSDFRHWQADEPALPTHEACVQSYEEVEDATCAQMFESLSSDVNQLCLTQSQIKNFVRKHRQWLRTDGYATFFLFKSYDQLFVASVRIDIGGRLGIGVNRFNHPRVRLAQELNRVVIPQLVNF